MSYKEKPQLKLYKYENSSFVLQAIIDDYKDVSFQRNMYQAGAFTITINYNIPNAQKFERGMFIQFGNDKYDFDEILKIQDTIGKDGKGSQIRTITGYDSRYILKRRVIKNLNDGDNWSMTSKGELCIRNLVLDQCGTNAEEKRRLPISNTIPTYADAIGKEYSVKEQFTNLYEVCKTIATQTEIGWRMKFNGDEFILECYEGDDKSQTVQFSPDFDSLSNGEFVDTNESFSNAIYIGGKGQNTKRDIYEGENLIEETSPSGLDRFESWDNQSQMTNEDEYETEAKSMLTQYGQTLQMSGNGLAKCPYIYKEQYDVGDWITVSFSNKKAIVQILSVEERWSFGNYEINFSFGKPKNNLSDQLQLMLRKIQMAANKGNYIDSVRWYEIPDDDEMEKSDVTFNTIGFTGEIESGGNNFTLYTDDEGTGSKTYRLYVKNLSGTDKLTLKTNKAGSESLQIPAGTYIGSIYVDDDGNVRLNSMTPANTVQEGNFAPVTSDAVAQAIGGGILNDWVEITAQCSALAGSDYVARFFYSSSRKQIKGWFYVFGSIANSSPIIRFPKKSSHRMYFNCSANTSNQVVGSGCHIQAHTTDLIFSEAHLNIYVETIICNVDFFTDD